MASTLAAGTVVAGFRVETLLGEGGIGRVCAARDEDGRRVALKLLARSSRMTSASAGGSFASPDWLRR